MVMVCTVLDLILKTSESGDRVVIKTPKCGGRDDDNDIDDKKHWN